MVPSETALGRGVFSFVFLVTQGLDVPNVSFDRRRDFTEIDLYFVATEHLETVALGEDFFLDVMLDVA